MQEVILFYNGLGIPTRQILDSRGAIPSKTAADAKIAIQEMAEYSLKWHNGTSRSRSTETSDGLAVIQAQLNNLGREIKKVNEKVYAAQVGCKQCKGPHYTIDCPLKEEEKILEEAYYKKEDLEVYLALLKQTREIKSSRFQLLLKVIHTRYVVLDLPNTPVGEERIVFTSVKPASSLIKRVYMLSLRERMELDLEARLMGETLVLNRSLDPFLEDYIELNDLNEPFELKKNQGDNLIPTIKEGEVIEEFRTRDGELNVGIDDYPRALMNVPIFVGTFFVGADFAVLEDMDAYRNKRMDDVIFGEIFLREVRIKARWFEGIITIYNGDDEVTYQMVRSHPRFKHHTNEQCHKIPPLLKVSEKDEKNGISHAYQKLKGFYKGVLNLGPNYIRDEKTKEWLTREHISVHEME
ncbi:homeodomain-like protein [Tanacetum coccineum]|uniref:Homeodomain-like protein n=1 Tax=Tanacetum coccineum TaxID=301880 RepID=A0ABQ5F3G2_9ASTR